jgi:hypothetical protein
VALGPDRTDEERKVVARPAPELDDGVSAGELQRVDPLAPVAVEPIADQPVQVGGQVVA